MPSDGSKNGKDPWGTGRKETPPDLDEVLRNLQTKLLRALGGKRPVSAGKTPTTGLLGLGSVLVVALVIWALSGIYIISPGEEAVVLRFGKYVYTAPPGPHWIPLFIDSRTVLNVQQIDTLTYQSEMLTKDENIVSVAVSVQYRIDNARNYLYNVSGPVASLEQATASALRQVVGSTTLDDILTSGRETVRDQMAETLREMLTIYRSGLQVTEVTLQPVKPPEAVTAAFDDAIKAREDQQRYINEANAYREKIVPIAQGQVSRILAEAKAYKQELVLQAKAQTAEYLAMLPEFQRSPEVTRARIYLGALEAVLSKMNKVFVDTTGTNILYLPLDKLAQEAGPKKTPSVATGGYETSVVSAPMPSEMSVLLPDISDRSSRQIQRGAR